MEVAYKYETLLPFEREFNVTESTLMVKSHLPKSFFIAALYIAGIFLLQEVMRSRVAFDLRRPLVLWNVALAVFSLLGAVRTVPELFGALYNHGLYYSVCTTFATQRVPAFWAWLFSMSKVVELGDTVMLVLRKRPLIFLHWFHHSTVLCYSFYSFQQHIAYGRWFMAMNFSIHTFMYAYYGLRAAGVRKIPVFIPKALTVCQIGQMFVGAAVAFLSLYHKLSGDLCQPTYENVQFTLIMYTAYLLLFVNFFYRSYYGERPKYEQQKIKKSD